MPKDILNNVRATGEFVVNIFGEGLAKEVNASSVEATLELNEFEIAQIEVSSSLSVHSPRVRLAPIHFESKLNQIVESIQTPAVDSKS
jgi:flavin reductase (DIM6/NTAB) family NADH-FMN oxidoreductase RutF